MRTDDKVSMPPDRAYLIAIAGTMATMWLKKSVTTATMMRQGQKKPDIIPDRLDEHKISQEWIEQFIACPYKNCKLVYLLKHFTYFFYLSLSDQSKINKSLFISKIKQADRLMDPVAAIPDAPMQIQQ